MSKSVEHVAFSRTQELTRSSLYFGLFESSFVRLLETQKKRIKDLIKTLQNQVNHKLHLELLQLLWMSSRRRRVHHVITQWIWVITSPLLSQQTLRKRKRWRSQCDRGHVCECVSHHRLTKLMNLGENCLSSELLSCGGSPFTTCVSWSNTLFHFG